MSPGQEAAVSRYLYEIGYLKLAKRTGWWQAGVPEPESIAEHCFRTAVIGYVLAVLEQADANVTAVLCLFHDTTEARSGDIPNVAGRYVSSIADTKIAEEQVYGLPHALEEAVVGLVKRFATQDSMEAQLAKDADRLECILQAREYEQQGFRNTRPWMESNRSKLRSSSAKALALRALEVPPDEWWKSFDHAAAVSNAEQKA